MISRENKTKKQRIYSVRMLKSTHTTKHPWKVHQTFFVDISQLFQNVKTNVSFLLFFSYLFSVVSVYNSNFTLYDNFNYHINILFKSLNLVLYGTLFPPFESIVYLYKSMFSILPCTLFYDSIYKFQTSKHYLLF